MGENESERERESAALYSKEITTCSYPGYDKNANRNLSTVSQLSKTDDSHGSD
jgi:hypothetical protein